ncbi:MAG: RNA polymerase sigma factor [Bacteroidales bacterium]|nr:RNA polymerase sigma factor [Bacteroidales bacterium]
MYKELDETQLAAGCRRGDSGATEELYRRYAARLFALCKRYTSSLEDAEDLMQESMIRALDKINSFEFKGDGSLYAWISRIAINMALNNIRKRKSQPNASEQGFSDDVPDPSESEMMSVPQEKLLEMISRLPETRRAVFNLYCIDGFSHREIGKTLGISEKGSASILAKARAQLKEDIYRFLNED